MNYLGLDYGEKHVGVALATGSLAEPLTTIDTSHSLRLIKQLMQKHDIDAIVAGDCPEKFLNKLSQLGLPVHQADETLSTYDATQSLLHTTQSRRKTTEHAVAAALILQHWLDASTSTQHQP